MTSHHLKECQSAYLDWYFVDIPNNTAHKTVIHRIRRFARKNLDLPVLVCFENQTVFFRYLNENSTDSSFKDEKVGYDPNDSSLLNSFITQVDDGIFVWNEKGKSFKSIFPNNNKKRLQYVSLLEDIEKEGFKCLFEIKDEDTIYPLTYTHDLDLDTQLEENEPEENAQDSKLYRDFQYRQALQDSSIHRPFGKTAADNGVVDFSCELGVNKAILSGNPEQEMNFDIPSSKDEQNTKKKFQPTKYKTEMKIGLTSISMPSSESAPEVKIDIPTRVSDVAMKEGILPEVKTPLLDSEPKMITDMQSREPDIKMSILLRNSESYVTFGDASTDSVLKVGLDDTSTAFIPEGRISDTSTNSVPKGKDNGTLTYSVPKGIVNDTLTDSVPDGRVNDILTESVPKGRVIDTSTDSVLKGKVDASTFKVLKGRMGVTRTDNTQEVRVKDALTSSVPQMKIDGKLTTDEAPAGRVNDSLTDTVPEMRVNNKSTNSIPEVSVNGTSTDIEPDVRVSDISTINVQKGRVDDNSTDSILEGRTKFASADFFMGVSVNDLSTCVQSRVNDASADIMPEGRVNDTSTVSVTDIRVNDTSTVKVQEMLVKDLTVSVPKVIVSNALRDSVPKGRVNDTSTHNVPKGRVNDTSTDSVLKERPKIASTDSFPKGRFDDTLTDSVLEVRVNNASRGIVPEVRANDTLTDAVPQVKADDTPTDSVSKGNVINKSGSEPEVRLDITMKENTPLVSVDDTLTDSVLAWKVNNISRKSIPERRVNDTTTDSIPKGKVDYTSTDNVPNRKVKDTSTHSVPEVGDDDMLKNSVPEVKLDDLLTNGVPEGKVNDIPIESVPKLRVEDTLTGGDDYTLTDNAPEGRANDTPTDGVPKGKVNNTSTNSVLDVIVRNASTESSPKGRVDDTITDSIPKGRVYTKGADSVLEVKVNTASIESVPKGCANNALTDRIPEGRVYDTSTVIVPKGRVNDTSTDCLPKRKVDYTSTVPKGTVDDKSTDNVPELTLSETSTDVRLVDTLTYSLPKVRVDDTERDNVHAEKLDNKSIDNVPEVILDDALKDYAPEVILNDTLTDTAPEVKACDSSSDNITEVIFDEISKDSEPELRVDDTWKNSEPIVKLDNTSVADAEALDYTLTDSAMEARLTDTSTDSVAEVKPSADCEPNVKMTMLSMDNELKMDMPSTDETSNSEKIENMIMNVEKIEEDENMHRLIIKKKSHLKTISPLTKSDHLQHKSKQPLAKSQQNMKMNMAKSHLENMSLIMSHYDSLGEGKSVYSKESIRMHRRKQCSKKRKKLKKKRKTLNKNCKLNEKITGKRHIHIKKKLTMSTSNTKDKQKDKNCKKHLNNVKYQSNLKHKGYNCSIIDVRICLRNIINLFSSENLHTEYTVFPVGRTRRGSQLGPNQSSDNAEGTGTSNSSSDQEIGDEAHDQVIEGNAQVEGQPPRPERQLSSQREQSELFEDQPSNEGVRDVDGSRELHRNERLCPVQREDNGSLEAQSSGVKPHSMQRSMESRAVQYYEQQHLYHSEHDNSLVTQSLGEQQHSMQRSVENRAIQYNEQQHLSQSEHCETLIAQSSGVQQLSVQRSIESREIRAFEQYISRSGSNGSTVANSLYETLEQDTREMNVERRELQDANNSSSLLAEPPEGEEEWHSSGIVDGRRECQGNERPFQRGHSKFLASQPSDAGVQWDNRMERRPAYSQATFRFPTQESNASSLETTTPNPQVSSHDHAPEHDLVSSSQTQGNRTFSSAVHYVRRNVECRIGNRHDQQTQNNMQLQLARHPRYANHCRRLHSFQTVSSTVIHCTVDQNTLAESGFFYADEDDCVRCFHCDGGLRHWNAEDDPWIEHAYWFPHCTYLREKMGQNFIDMVQQAAAEVEAEEEIRPTQRSHCRRPIQHLPAREEQTVAASGSRHLSENRDGAAAPPPGTHHVVQSSTDGEIHSIHYEIWLYEEFGVRLTARNIRRNIGPRSNTRRASSPTTNELLEENRRMKEELMCHRCKRNNLNMLFLPCEDHFLCQKCAQNLQSCPKCGKIIRLKVKTYRC